MSARRDKPVPTLEGQLSLFDPVPGDGDGDGKAVGQPDPVPGDGDGDGKAVGQSDAPAGEPSDPAPPQSPDCDDETDLGEPVHDMRARYIKLVTRLVDPSTGETILDEEGIRKALNQFSPTVEWAWVIHDKDVYTEADEAENPAHVAGTPIPAHVHVVLSARNPIYFSTVAKRFGVPTHLVKKVEPSGGSGPRGFARACQYLTHESEEQQAKGKHLYSDEEVHANFDFRERVDSVGKDLAKYDGQYLEPDDRMAFDIRYHGKTLYQAMQEDRVMFMKSEKRFREMRMAYVDGLPMPQSRVCIYICGKSGVGKGVMSMALARSLFRTPDGPSEEETYFTVGAGKATFEHYDGEPCIIFSDGRTRTLVEKLGDRPNVFNVFDPHPPRVRQNVKFGSVSLVSPVIIVNSVQGFSEFVHDMSCGAGYESGRREEGTQIKRRFQILVMLREDSYDLYVNKGCAEGSNEFGSYISVLGIPSHFAWLAKNASGAPELRAELEDESLAPIVEWVRRFLAPPPEVDPDMVRSQYTMLPGRSLVASVAPGGAFAPAGTAGSSMDDHAPTGTEGASTGTEGASTGTEGASTDDQAA